MLHMARDPLSSQNSTGAFALTSVRKVDSLRSRVLASENPTVSELSVSGCIDSLVLLWKCEPVRFKPGL